MAKRNCSWCFAETTHEPVERNRVRRSVYRCTACGNRTLECRVCKNMARSGKWDSEYCAVHDGTIASFEALGMKLPDITEWKRITKRNSVNMVKAGKIVGGAAAVALVGTGAGLAAAPAIGGAIGVAGGLSGAAAAGHGLAFLGGGAVAAGGLGVAGGTAVIAVTAGVLGAAGGGVLVNKYVGNIEGFGIQKVHAGMGMKVVFVNGFLSQGESLLEDWRTPLGEFFPDHSWYEVAWESKRLRTLGTFVARGGAKQVGRYLARQLATQATKQAGKRLGPLGWALALGDLGGNPWTIALCKAAMTGELLATLILRDDSDADYVLMGHSLGARVIYFALAALAAAGPQRGVRARIVEAHLLGGAVSNDGKLWRSVTGAVRGRIYNYFSTNDAVLSFLYRPGTLFMSTPIGREPIALRSEKIVNVDASAFVSGHSEFKRTLHRYFRGRRWSGGHRRQRRPSRPAGNHRPS